MATNHPASLREKQAEATREHLLGTAFELLVERSDEPFSHEAVARAAGVGARTVYRYFPAQADLLEALWLQLRERTGTVFPTSEEEIIPKLVALYRAFEQNENLVRAVMESGAGARVRAQGTWEGRTSFEQSLRELTYGASAGKRRQARAVFQSIHSGPFWQMLRDRGGLSGEEAVAAAGWAEQALLEALRREKKNSGGQTEITKKGKGGGPHK